MGHENEPRPSWSEAPDGWNWLAQDADGRWFWYAVEPQLGLAGGVWRSPRSAQQFARRGEANPLWYETCTTRPEQTPDQPHKEEI